MFSITTMESSTSRPSDRISENRVMRLMLWPATMPTASVMNRISGMVMVTIEAARQPRKSDQQQHHGADGDGQMLDERVDRVVGAWRRRCA